MCSFRYSTADAVPERIRRNLFNMKKLLIAGLLACLLAPVTLSGAKKTVESDRMYWCRLMYRMAKPILEPMSEGRLQAEMMVEVGPTWDHRNIKVAYLEAFGRLMDGLAPWLALPDDDTEEGQMRRQLREWALKSLANAVDPASPDYLLWREEGQTLVDAAFLAEGLLRAYDALWVPLDDVTKSRYIEEFTQLRRVDPPYTNWLLFSATTELMLLKAGAPCDRFRINTALRKIDEWYVGDGWYSDGQQFAFDYYNSYVIQPMYLECLETVARPPFSWSGYRGKTDVALRRMQKYAIILERFISPEGTFPAFGRSIPYRMAAMQPLAMLAWRRQLPAELSGGQVRAALTAVMKRMFDDKYENFNEKDYLTLGFVGRQQGVTDSYTNNGILYLTSLVFLPLGLPADDPFWTSEPQPWTQQKAWSGVEFPKDHAYKE